MMKWLSVIGMLLCAHAHAAPPPRWAAYYSDALTPHQFASYQLLVLDSHAHPDLHALKQRGATLLGYISLAEAADYRPSYAHLTQSGWLLGAIPGRPGYAYIDVRKPEWTAYIVEALIPDLLRQGFDGVMLDTADSGIGMEAKYPGMRNALIALIRTIRLHYPQIKIMLNRGFALLPDVADAIDMELAESIYATHDAKGFRRQPEAHFRSVAQMLNALREKYPHLGIYTLDYWPQNEPDAIKEIYAVQRAEGFIPYVSAPDLQSVQEEPQ